MTSATPAASPSAAFNRFVSRTGMHAVPNIASERRTISRVCWGLLLLLAVAILTRQVWGLAVKLMSYPTSTSTVVDHHSPMVFPAVTLCNLNPLRLNALQGLSGGSRRMRRAANSDPAVLDLLTLVGVAEPPPPPQMDSSRIMFAAAPMLPTTPPPALSDGSAGRGRRQDFDMRQRALHIMNNFPAAILDRVTYNLEDILVDCSFQGRACLRRDFVRIMTPRMGACYTFNSGANGSDLLEIFSSGSINGLDLTLFLDQKNYLPNVANIAGYKILIHDPARPPMPDEEGFVVAPGVFTSFGLRMTVFERAREPFGRCRDFNEEDNRRLNMFSQAMPHTGPSLEVCMRTCHQLQILTRCRCYSMELGYAKAPAFSDVNQTARRRPCDVTEGTDDFRCVESLASSTVDRCKETMCRHLACKSKRFEVSQSSAKWPALKTLKEFSSQVEALGWEGIPRRMSPTFVSMNFLKVRIYFDDVNVIHFKTKPAYTITDFLSDLGGQGGLWLGISAFTLVELAVLIGDLMKTAVCRSPKPQEAPAEEMPAIDEKESTMQA